MSIKIKAYVLIKWNITEFGVPMVFPSYDTAYKEMEKQYNEAIGSYSWHSEDESGFYTESAKIGTEEGIEEWQISECEMEINNLHEFTSAFETLLGQYSADFEVFVKNIPQAIAMAITLTEKLQEMQALLAAALPNHGGNKKDGVDNV